ncbi:unnamed protein product [Darwinula stevensoni]|uniref:Uncharacterized protein n=1 Tax=Darwinula stevensoni TaxID=69355 RepID=A0A7R9ADL9_9CRUS|nr:unnamed protein product [Darwinula stevensoni]CAG0901226.1 unnamed protein product [Darwinula stevensoni]
MTPSHDIHLGAAALLLGTIHLPSPSTFHPPPSTPSSPRAITRALISTSGLCAVQIHGVMKVGNESGLGQCFVCHSMNQSQGEKCVDLNLTAFNVPVEDCAPDYCLVRRYKYAIHNDTQKWHTWAVRRNCTDECHPGCVLMGQRTKIHICTSCCTTHLCNVGDQAPSALGPQRLLLLPSLVAVTLLGT